MTTTTYIIAWIIYLSAASVMSSILWKLSESWHQDFRTACRVSLIIILFTPYFSEPEQYKLAPAFLITFFELIFGNPMIALKASTPLVLLLVIGIAFSLAFHVMRQKKS